MFHMPGNPETQVQPAQVQPAQVQPAQVQPAQVQPAQVQPAPVSITLTPYGNKAGTVKTYIVANLAESRNLLSAIIMMDKYLEFVFSGQPFTAEKNERNIANIKQEIISQIDFGKSAGVFVDYSFNKLINNTVHNMKGIINVHKEIQELNFPAKEAIEEACLKALTQYQNFKDPTLKTAERKAKRR